MNRTSTMTDIYAEALPDARNSKKSSKRHSQLKESNPLPGSFEIAKRPETHRQIRRTRGNERADDFPEGERMSKTATVADHLAERLIEWGVDTIFGFPGDGINGIFEALRTRQDKLRFIQVRHEEAAAFAACGYAKYTGRLGVCLATSGPGRNPPSQRSLRREMRRAAGTGHYRPYLP